MGSVPVQRTWVTGETTTAAEMTSNARDSINFLLSPPRAVITVLGSAFNVTSGISPQLLNEWDTAVTNQDGMWAAGSPSRLTANTPGLYQTTVSVHYPYLSTMGTYHVGVALNNGGGTWGGSSRLAEDTRPGSNASSLGTSCSITIEQYMNTNDYFEFYTTQTTGSTLVITNSLFSVQASARWIASS